MAASSSTAASIFTAEPNISYPACDVFINCGVDVKKTFARSLYYRLRENELTAFPDIEELQPREEILPRTKAAIRSASLHVAIFSPRYAESQWCLNELILMLETEAPIIPVFYHVKPSELRCAKAPIIPFFYHFIPSQLRWTQGKHGNYAQALQRLEQEPTDEGNLRYDSGIIEGWKNALYTVACMSGLELEACYGDEGELLDKVEQRLLKLVEKEKYLTGLDEKLKDFEETVQHSTKPQPIQEKFKIKYDWKDQLKILQPIQENLSYDGKDQLETLQSIQEKPNINVKPDMIFNPNMSYKPNISVKPDMIDNPNMSYNPKISSGKKDGRENVSIQPIQEKPNISSYDWEDRWENLRIHYDSLSVEEKQIFLDIACFFIGKNKDMAIRIWDGSGWKGRLGFENLQNKCLVEVDSWNMIQMPYRLRDFGRVVAAEATSQRRLWRWTENVSDDLVQKLSEITFRGIRKVLSEDNDYDEFSAIGNMSLQLPDTQHSHLDRIWRRVKFSNLIWLRWRECPYVSLPSWIPMKNLRVLHVSGNSLEILWQDGSEAPSQLEELWADGCMQLKSVRGLSKCTELRKLIVNKCWELEELPGVETLVSLEELRVDECLMLKSIESLAKCTKLRYLKVSGCSELKWLPTMESLVSLEEFCASECVMVKSSIPGLEHCRKLRHLDVSGCLELEALPTMKTLVFLEELWANRCVKLKSIRGLEQATKLRLLNVSDCFELQELPNMEKLKCLEELWADNCVKLKSIRGLEQATKLRILNVSDCSALKELPIMRELLSLKILRATGCVKLNNIKGLEQCTKLSILSVSRCCELEELPSMERLAYLDEFYASECVKLKSIQGLEKLTKLRHLNVSNCPDLKELPSMERLESLEMIRVTGCVKLNSIQGLAQCTKLRKLSVSGCCELQELPGIETLTCLEALRVEECVKLRSITAFEQCGKLRHLDVSGCSQLQKFPSMETLVCLEEFYAFDCNKLKSIKGLAQCADLRTLSVDGCSELEELPSMEKLVSLEELRVKECVTLKSISGLAQCTNLRLLDVRRCSELKELEGVEHCTLLEKLDLSKCPKLVLGMGVLDQLRGRLGGRLKGGVQSRRSRFAWLLCTSVPTIVACIIFCLSCFVFNLFGAPSPGMGSFSKV